MSTSRNLVCALAALSLSAGFHAGCRHELPAHPARGAARFQILEPRASAKNKAVAILDVGQRGEIITDANPILPLAMPVYPSSALRARHNGAVISVQVVVDPTGRVRTVSPSLSGFSSSGSFAEEFQAAVESAVLRWRFHPAEARMIELLRHPDGRVEQKIVRREPVEARFDLAFTFTSTGDVLPAR